MLKGHLHLPLGWDTVLVLRGPSIPRIKCGLLPAKQVQPNINPITFGSFGLWWGVAHPLHPPKHEEEQMNLCPGPSGNTDSPRSVGLVFNLVSVAGLVAGKSKGNSTVQRSRRNCELGATTLRRASKSPSGL